MSVKVNSSYFVIQSVYNLGAIEEAARGHLLVVGTQLWPGIEGKSLP